ncbi:MULTISPECIES: hypothetical protein [Paraburkholderia]|uniref:hypothetical protein n=1 Tax=Paraburkholderia TaxID=1822464 RepID=UPI0002D5DB4D|nr:hypothetical protein [Paraburkholderia hospita]
MSGSVRHRAGHLPLSIAAGYRWPLFLGIDTHALSEPGYTSALEVLNANDVEVVIA